MFLKMKISKFVILLFIVITNHNSIAQSINDTIFKNVVLIEEEDIVKSQEDYLVDVVLDFKSNHIPIIFNYSRVSKHFFLDRFLKHKSLILITPDWDFYNKVAKEANAMGGCIEPATTNIIYQRKYFENKPKIDSIRVSGNQPKLIFTERLKNLESDDNIIFYHSESFGSSCCPRDPRRNMIKTLNAYISSFEEKNDIKIGNVYKRITGKEGEHTLYFTLSNLNKQQKISFLKGRFKSPPQIFMPSVTKKEGLRLSN